MLKTHTFLDWAKTYKAYNPRHTFVFCTPTHTSQRSKTCGEIPHRNRIHLRILFEHYQCWPLVYCVLSKFSHAATHSCFYTTSAESLHTPGAKKTKIYTVHINTHFMCTNTHIHMPTQLSAYPVPCMASAHKNQYTCTEAQMEAGIGM